MTGPNSAVMEVLAWLQKQLGEARARELQIDSRRIQTGDVFVALPGAQHDGRDFVETALQRGAAAVLVEAHGWRPRLLSAPVLTVNHLAALLGPLAARWYGQPSEALLAIGVTGTNGKTSCSQWIAQALDGAGLRCGVIGTVGSGFPGATFAAATLTTPDAISLQKEVRRLSDAGARALAMEVSSIGLDQGRVNGMKFDIAVFTNLTRDHLDYHRNMRAYEEAKTLLFNWPTLSHAVLNLDDAVGRRLLQRLAPRARMDGLQLFGYAVGTVPDELPLDVLAQTWLAQDLRSTARGQLFTLRCDSWSQVIEVPLLGRFNVENLLATAATLSAAGIERDKIAALLTQLQPPMGRMQQVNAPGAGASQPLVVVDYAHTPDAISKALQALRPVSQARSGQLVVVFGAGGDRDPGKRAPMGAAAAEAADRLIITSDNPRTEDPAAIVAAVAQGVPASVQCEQIIDRAQAIARAVTAAADQDVVLIAGKGHEEYQDIGGRKQSFSDVAQAKQALEQRLTPAASSTTTRSVK